MRFLASFLFIFSILKITSSDLLNETLSEEADHHYCESQNIFGDEIEEKLENLKKCHVIEGHLRLHRLTLPEGTSLSNLIQVTDHIILERVEGLESLAVLFPRLLVIRGQDLFFEKYAVILNGNFELREIGPWSLISIMHGAVHVEDNIFMCTEEGEWNKFIKFQFRRFNLFKNNLDFCPFMGCEEKGYCEKREKSCRSLGLSCPDVKQKNCSSECVGGCYEPSDSSACVACKNFQYYEGNVSKGVWKCVEECPPNHLNYKNYRCITYEECNQKGYFILDSEDTSFLYKESPEDLSGQEKMYLPKYRNSTNLCIKDCPDKFTPKKNTRFCQLRRVCETTIITDDNLGGNLKYCDKVDGNLIIFVAGGKNVTQQLEENLKRLETVVGYVKVAGADALYSLSFLSNLKLIEGKEVVSRGGNHEGYALYLFENSNLKELWDWDFRPKELRIKGSVYIGFNDRLCDSEIAKFRRIANIEGGKITSHTNGIYASCRIFHTHLTAIPGSTNGTILLSWVHNFCGVDSRYVYGYQVFYRPVTSNISKYQGRDVCNDNRLFKRNIAELKVVHQPICMEWRIECLTPNTIYAIYVESIGIHNIKYKIESEIVYATTYNDYIEKPGKENLELTNDGILLSWEPPKVPIYTAPEEIVYEIILTLDGDPVEDLSKEATTVKELADCLCDSQSKDTYFVKKQIREFITMKNEISALSFRKSKSKPLVHSRPKRSSSQNFDVHDAACGLKSYNIASAREYKNKTCKTMRSNASDCKEPKVEAISSSLRFQKSILRSSWTLKDGVHRKSEKTENTTIFVNLPQALDSLYMPKKISVSIRSCVGEINPCPPLQSNESCSICSDFLNFFRLTIDNSTLPIFDVKLLKENDSINSGHKLRIAECMKTSGSLKDIGKSLLDIADEIENGEIIDEKSSNGSAMPPNKKVSSLLISLKEPIDLINFALGYRIFYYKMSVFLSMKESAIQFYINKSAAQEMGNRFKIPAEASSESYVGFQVHYNGGYGPLSGKCLTILETEAFGYLIYLLCGLFVILGVFSMAIVFRLSKAIWKNILNLKNGWNLYTNKVYFNLKIFEDKLDDKFKEYNIEVSKDSKELGKGHFGKVYQGKARKKGSKDTDAAIPVAVKTINVENLEKDSSDYVEAFFELLEEGIRMQKFDCFFIIKLVAASVNDLRSLRFAMEYMDTDLKKYLEGLKEGILSEEAIVQILSQVSVGISYMHDNNFIHRDIAARNCLVQYLGSRGDPSIVVVVKVGDFGLARLLNEDYVYVQSASRDIPAHSSPEAIRGVRFDKRSDVWSFGLLINEIVTKCAHKPNNGVKRKWSDEEVKDFIKTLVSPCYRYKFLESLIVKCLALRPEDRLTFQEIVDKLLSSRIASEDFVTWCKSQAGFHNSGVMDSKSDSCISASRSESRDNEVDDEGDCGENVHLVLKENSGNQSSCLSVNSVHHTIFGRKKHSSESESFIHELNY